MKRKITTFIFGLLFLIGFAVLIYPTVSNQWNTYRQQQLISTYDKAVSKLEPEDFDAAWEAAESFNNSFDHNDIFGDVFSTQSKLTDIKDTEYWKVLNIEGNGIMGYLSIPKINVKLSIYHGTSDEVLQTGVGHLNGTKLPIGGESTHSVLSAHRGLPSAKLFTDIDQLKKGDRFYLHILNKDFAYEVDQILPMVDKDDHETLDKALQIEEGQDYVTLFTCTPYGVNTHRLLVRGHRIPYDGEELASTPADTMVQAIQNYYMLFLLLGLAVTALVIVLMKYLFKPRKKQAKKDLEEGKK
ncbi:MAG: class C sortase [Faecalicatena sp.]|uniref:class C sortase n=1 Tax=Faecalicatena sp. TaxID=2005360 RepID=UPI00258AB002|nr:class C sortase [Faecalicatena sp.]MCI6466737.1 class C sortase [Faecalicatena sp.]MCI7181976.1 class C sortase [Lachnospiraceae bacterium]MDY5619127.1 class C sortase [Lachnospiraceae bacterium]